LRHRVRGIGAEVVRVEFEHALEPVGFGNAVRDQRAMDGVENCGLELARAFLLQCDGDQRHR
jgi:hypothetical protein